MHPLAKALTLYVIFLTLLAFSGCTKKESVGLYEPSDQGSPTPTITSISPADIAFSGMDTIIIQGTNFSSLSANNTVYFGPGPAVLLSSTPTQITLQAPIVAAESVGVRVAVRGAFSFSNTYPYRLVAGAAEFGGLDTTQQSAALATDATGNLYAAFCTGNKTAGTLKDAGILKITPAGTQATFANATSGVPLWTGLKMGPGGYLYAAKGIPVIYRFPLAGGASAALWQTFPSGNYLSDIDFDQDGNLWAGGNTTKIYRVDRNKVVASYPFAGNIHSVRVYNNYLYFAAKVNGVEKIWRAPITAGALGTPEVYYDFGAAYPSSVPQAITFSSDGTLFIGTSTQEGLVIVEPGKAPSSPFTAYQSLFGAGISFLAWGSGNTLYASTSNGALLRFIIRDKTSAPYYGSTL